MSDAIPVARLNHAVLYVRDLDRAVDFYQRAFGFEEIAREFGADGVPARGRLRATTTTSASTAVGADAPSPPPGFDRPLPPRVGGAGASTTSPARPRVLAELDALTGMSDHGATKSLYGQDPDGNEFEVMWLVPREHWGEYDRHAVVQPLDLARELARYGANAADAARGDFRLPSARAPYRSSLTVVARPPAGTCAAARPAVVRQPCARRSAVRERYRRAPTASAWRKRRASRSATACAIRAAPDPGADVLRQQVYPAQLGGAVGDVARRVAVERLGAAEAGRRAAALDQPEAERRRRRAQERAPSSARAVASSASR